MSRDLTVLYQYTEFQKRSVKINTEDNHRETCMYDLFFKREPRTNSKISSLWHRDCIWLAKLSRWPDKTVTRENLSNSRNYTTHHRVTVFITRSLRSATRRQRQRHKFCIFIEQKRKHLHALHLLLLSLYISFLFSANLRWAITISQVIKRMWTPRRQFQFSFLALTLHL